MTAQDERTLDEIADEIREGGDPAVVVPDPTPAAPVFDYDRHAEATARAVATALAPAAPSPVDTIAEMQQAALNAFDINHESYDPHRGALLQQQAFKLQTAQQEAAFERRLQSVTAPMLQKSTLEGLSGGNQAVEKELRGIMDEFGMGSYEQVMNHAPSRKLLEGYAENLRTKAGVTTRSAPAGASAVSISDQKAMPDGVSDEMITAIMRSARCDRAKAIETIRRSL